jgi:hypothetical protein
MPHGNKKDRPICNRKMHPLQKLLVLIWTIENGMNLMQIGGMVLGLFKRKGKSKALPEIEFSTVAKNSYDQNSILKP